MTRGYSSRILGRFLKLRQYWTAYGETSRKRRATAEKIRREIEQERARVVGFLTQGKKPK